jgi:hypothetical protein
MPHISEFVAESVEQTGLSRRHFLKNTARFVSAAMLANSVLPDIAFADDNINEVTEPSILSQPGDKPMGIGINIPKPSQLDVEAIESGEFEQKVFWATPQTSLSPIDKYNHKVPLLASAASVKATQAVGETYIVVPSTFDEKIANPKQAPHDRGVNGQFGKFMHHTIRSHFDADAFIDANEPDLVYGEDANAAMHAAQMTITTDKIMHELGYKGLLLCPASSDISADMGTQFLIDYVNYLNYYLSYEDYELKTETALAVHVYRGVNERRLEGIATAATLARKYFPSDNHQVYVTESGYKFKVMETGTQYVYEYDPNVPLRVQDKEQAANMEYIYGICRALGFYTMDNYTFHDTQFGGGGFMSGYINYDNQPHLIYKKRAELRKTRPVSAADMIVLQGIEKYVDSQMASIVP